MASVLIPREGRGKELFDLLKEFLHLPANVQRFSVHFELNEAVRVDCVYLPATGEKDKPK